jgi:hypothetical protein
METSKKTSPVPNNLLLLLSGFPEPLARVQSRFKKKFQ